jgi:actin-like ATPase involved in cell morphogenesis
MSSSPKIACVWGANGISGTAMIETLVKQSRNEWSKIICISRRPTQLDVDDTRIYFISIDILTAGVNEIVAELSKVGGEAITHVYHYTYIEKKDEKELDEVNKILFQKALDVTVKIAGKQVKCVSLQTGYKVKINFYIQKFKKFLFSIMVSIKVVNILHLLHILKTLLVIKDRIFTILKKIF